MIVTPGLYTKIKVSTSPMKDIVNMYSQEVIGGL
jgi:hypothetical protein